MANKAIFLFLFLQLLTFCTSFPLSTNSRWIVDDATGNRVKLACANWPSHLEPMVPEGLDKKPISYIAKEVVANGFNCIRFTWATHMFTRPGFGRLTVSQSLDRYSLSDAKAGIAKNNPRFLNMRLVEAHQAVVDELGRHKVMVVLDNQVSRPSWCCGNYDGNGFFGDADFDPNEWLAGVAAVARTYRGHPAVVGMSTRNELRGPRQNLPDWYKYVQLGANAIHRENPDLLVVISGMATDTKLNFLKDKPLEVNFNNKIVYEAHWYSFGYPTDSWVNKTNELCANVTKGSRDNFLFLTTGNNSFPLFLSEFGIDQNGYVVSDNRYISCLLASAAEYDIDWALWGFQGSYILREGHPNAEEEYGVLDINWSRRRNPAFLGRLNILRQINQDFKSKRPTYYKIFHPLSGKCVQTIKNKVVLSNCKDASHWEQHQDGGPIKLVGSPQCVGVAGDGSAARVSNDCSSSGSQWKYVSSSGLHLAAQDAQGKSLCLEKSASGDTIVTKKCLCVGDDLADLPTCPHNPQIQWFKLVPSNV